MVDISASGSKIIITSGTIPSWTSFPKFCTYNFDITNILSFRFLTSFAEIDSMDNNTVSALIILTIPLANLTIGGVAPANQGAAETALAAIIPAGGGGGTVTGANNGTSLSGANVVLGNDPGDEEMEGALQSDREIVDNGNSLIISDAAGSGNNLQLNSGGPIINNGAIYNNALLDQVIGSGSGFAFFTQPERGTGYKRVIILCINLVGSLTWSFPVNFASSAVILNTTGLNSSLISELTNNSVTVDTGDVNTNGILIIEGV